MISGYGDFSNYSDKQSDFTISSKHKDINPNEYSRDNSKYIHSKIRYEDPSEKSSAKGISEENSKIQQKNKSKKKFKKSKEDNKPNPPPKGEIGSKEKMSQIKEINHNGIGNIDYNSCYMEYIYSINKYPNLYGVCKSIRAKIFSDNTLIFVLPNCSTCCCKCEKKCGCLKCCDSLEKYDKDRYYIKSAVAILYVGCLMLFNILFEFDLSTLHLFNNHKKVFGGKIHGWFINIIPYFLVCFLINFFKDSLSLREFYLEEMMRINYISDKYEKNNTKKIILLHKEVTRIKKFRNNLENNIKLIARSGLVILAFNFYLVTCFCGIYENSFGCVIINIIYSIAISYIIILIIHIIDALSSCCDLKKCLYTLSICCCVKIYCIIFFFRSCYEEFNKLEKEDEIDDALEKNLKENINKGENNNNNNIPTHQVMTNQIIIIN